MMPDSCSLRWLLCLVVLSGPGRRAIDMTRYIIQYQIRIVRGDTERIHHSVASGPAIRPHGNTPPPFTSVLFSGRASLLRREPIKTL
ncbi:hypothetical protein HDV57DRAFT_137780 [Trichoderma longibrachiatum]